MERKPMTVDGKKRLDELLKKLVQVDRPKVIQLIKEARAHGDLSENADYEAAKEQQALLEGRIADLSAKLAVAQVVDTSKISSEKITFGAWVDLENLDDGAKQSYRIVGEDEADAAKGQISVSSPLAKRMIGLKKDDVFILKTPKGDREYEIKNFYFK